MRYRYTAHCAFFPFACSSLNCINIVILMNRYGHPHPELLDRLNDIGSEVAISYDSGAITIMTDGEKMVVEEYMKLVTGGRGY